MSLETSARERGVTDWAGELEPLLADGFSGVVSVSRGSEVLFERAYGQAERAHGIACTPQTRFAIASGTKGFTALVVMSLVAEGAVALTTPARSVLGADLPLIADDVTLEHLLTHRSGIGDYLDEYLEEPEPLKVPVYALVNTADYLPALDGFPTKFGAGTAFAYCNAGFIVLALIAERVSGRSYHELVAERVFAPAGMTESAFLRSDELPGDAAVGYLDDGRTNVFSVPVRGNGDGGAYTTVADMRRFWAALFSGELVPADVLDEMIRPHTEGLWGLHYGLGLWLGESSVELDGGDYGVTFRSAHDRRSGVTCTVIANVETRVRDIVSRALVSDLGSA
jgi:CubicO group peptidase (beta-lactamase class C family)